MKLPGKFNLSAVYPGNVSKDAPSIEDVMSILEKKSIGTGMLGGVTLSYLDRVGNDVRDSRTINFVVDEDEGVMMIYSWTSPAKSAEASDSIVVDDGGGNDLRISTRFFHEAEWLHPYLTEFLRTSKIKETGDWVAVSGFSENWH